MVSISQLRTQLRAIRKRIADKVGYQDFKYLHKMKRPELEALLKKYEKFETQVVGTIQNAIRNKRARNEASQLLSNRDERQVLRDLELRLNAISRPLSASVSNVSSSAQKKRNTIRDLYDAPLTPFSTFQLFSPTPPNISQVLPEQMFQQRSVAQGRVVPLSRIPKPQRPFTASPNLPAVNYRKRLEVKERPLTASGRLSGLPRVELKPRPSSSERTFNKLKPL